MLQHSKVDIRSAILRQIQRHKRNNQAVNSLECALVCLPSFQPKIGIKPIPKAMLSMMRSDGIHLEVFPAESEEFKKIVDEHSKEFKKLRKKRLNINLFGKQKPIPYARDSRPIMYCSGTYLNVEGGGRPLPNSYKAM